MKRNRSNNRIAWIAVIGVCGFLAVLMVSREQAVLAHRPYSQAQYGLAQGYHINVATGSLLPPPEDAVDPGADETRFSWLDLLRILLWGVWTGTKVVGGIVVNIIVLCVVGAGLAVA